MATVGEQTPNEKDIIALLQSINNKLGERKKSGFLDYFPLIVTFLSSVVLVVVGMYVTSREKEAEQQLQMQINAREDKFKEIDGLLKLGPDLTSTDSLKSTISLFGLYSMDKQMAINLVLALQVLNVKTAIQPLLASMDSAERGGVMRQLSKTTLNLAKSNSKNFFRDTVVARAVGEELVRSASAEKYIRESGLGNGTDPMVAFVLWCCQSGQLPDILHSKSWGMESLLPVLAARNYTFKASANYPVLPGDIAFFDFGERKGPQACGIVYRVDNTFTYTLEFEDSKVASVTRYLADAMVFARIPSAGK